MTLFLIIIDCYLTIIDCPIQVCNFWMGFVKTLETGRATYILDRFQDNRALISATVNFTQCQ